MHFQIKDISLVFLLLLNQNLYLKEYSEFLISTLLHILHLKYARLDKDHVVLTLWNYNQNNCILILYYIFSLQQICFSVTLSLHIYAGEGWVSILTLASIHLSCLDAGT